jgi:hypothetical protein
LGKEKANGQGEKMNSEEKKQYPIFGVPPHIANNLIFIILLSFPGVIISLEKR